MFSYFYSLTFLFIVSQSPFFINNSNLDVKVHHVKNAFLHNHTKGILDYYAEGSDA